MPRPILIDTDAGVDDSLALILALRSPELDVQAITTVAGNVEVASCTKNVLTILDELHVDDSLRVAQGASKPLRRRLVTAPEVHGHDGFGGVRPRRKSPRRIARIPAHRLIAAVSREWGKKLTVVALGPLTNIARALRENPRALKRIGRIISMGGAFRVAGNTGPVAEFNYFVDPEAADEVLRSGIPVTMVPLDLTQQLVVMHQEIRRRALRRANRISRLILNLTKKYMEYHKRTEHFFGGYLHDPIAVAVAINPSLFQTQSLHVEIETRGIVTRGMTVTDFRRRSEGALVDVALKMQREQFLKLFHERLWA